jgi:hypothetical protein
MKKHISKTFKFHNDVLDNKLNEIAVKIIADNFDSIREFATKCCIDNSVCAKLDIATKYASDIAEMRELGKTTKTNFDMPSPDNDEYWIAQIWYAVSRAWINTVEDDRKDPLMILADKDYDDRSVFDYISRLKNIQKLIDAGYSNERINVYLRAAVGCSSEYTFGPHCVFSKIQQYWYKLHSQDGECDYAEFLNAVDDAEKEALAFIEKHSQDGCLARMGAAAGSIDEMFAFFVMYRKCPEKASEFYTKVNDEFAEFNFFYSHLGCFNITDENLLECVENIATAIDEISGSMLENISEFQITMQNYVKAIGASEKIFSAQGSKSSKHWDPNATYQF